MKKIFLLLLVSMILCCCQDSDTLNDESVIESINLVDNNNLIDKDIQSISESDAMRMARKMMSYRAVSRASCDISIETVIDSIFDSPLLYIVNYGSDNGYAIISATKNYMPILAFSQRGHFSKDAGSGATDYLNNYKECIAEAIIDNSDSLKAKYSSEWSLYEDNKKDLQPSSRSTSTEIQDLINQEIKKKESLGYTYIGKISSLSSYLPLEEYNTVVADISQHTDSNYDYEEVSLLFVESFNFKEVGPLIGTEWGQYYPFNVDASNGRAGCVPIAVAQILYYYKYPSKYNWSNISMNPVGNADFNYFIKDVRDLCEVEYKSNGTSSNIDKAKKAFDKLGYNTTKLDYNNLETLRSETKSGRPVYLRGENGSDGHAWVCEGYQQQKYKAVVSVIMDKKYGLPNSGSKYGDYSLYINPTSAKDDTSSREYFYMNFGWYGSDNGWYRYDTYTASGDKFTKKQKTLIVKKP